MPLPAAAPADDMDGRSGQGFESWGCWVLMACRLRGQGSSRPSNARFGHCWTRMHVEFAFPDKAKIE